ncbi:MAG: hypothetical protein HFF09_07985 [Oscillospiraceae bacterium]|nr:hypothetical protein [Oscillospiraceae bacterium]
MKYETIHENSFCGGVIMLNKEKEYATDAEVINSISGAYSAPFWDSVIEVAGTLDTARKIQTVLSELNTCGKNREAYLLILAIYDLLLMDVPAAIAALEQPQGRLDRFIGEFLMDIEDLMHDYEYEERKAATEQ